MPQQKVLLITGANKGLGYAIASAAVARYPEAHYILACRDVEAGREAISKLQESNAAVSLELLKLDITKDEDIETAAKSVTERHARIDVLINNAGAAKSSTEESLAALREVYSEMFDLNASSVACMCKACKPLLYQSNHPQVINITSGLGSITNALQKKMHRLPAYGTSKVALNDLTAHLQTAENDRVEEEGNMEESKPKINYYVVAPGLLKTALTRFNQFGKEPPAGAEVVIRLLFSNEYPSGTQWQFENGKMEEVPW